MNITRNPAKETFRQYLQDTDPYKENSEFDRPYGDIDMWSYRVLRIERTIAWNYLHVTDGSQEDEIKRLTLAMYHFGCDIGYVSETKTIEDAWSEETKYPDSSYEFMRSSPMGQCGITDFGFGMLLGSTNLVDRKNIYYAEGELYAADGTLLDPNHTCLHVVGVGDKEWRIDLTSHQSAEKNPDPNGFMRIVMQPVRHEMEPHPLINQPPLSWSEYGNYSFPAQNASAIVFKEKTRTPIEEYDVRKFKGRLEKFVERSGMTALGEYLGSPASRYSFALKEDGIWYPDTYDFKQEGSDDDVLWGEFDDEIRRKVNEFEFRTNLTSENSYDNLNDKTKEKAENDAKEGVNLALRANIAHTAMQRGELVITDEDWWSKPYDAKETFDALQIAAGSLIGHDTLGSLAYQALHAQQKHSLDS